MIEKRFELFESWSQKMGVAHFAKLQKQLCWKITWAYHLLSRNNSGCVSFMNESQNNAQWTDAIFVFYDRTLRHWHAKQCCSRPLCELTDTITPSSSMQISQGFFSISVAKILLWRLCLMESFYQLHANSLWACQPDSFRNKYASAINVHLTWFMNQNNCRMIGMYDNHLNYRGLKRQFLDPRPLE